MTLPCRTSALHILLFPHQKNSFAWECMENIGFSFLIKERNVIIAVKSSFED